MNELLLALAHRNFFSFYPRVKLVSTLLLFFDQITCSVGQMHIQLISNAYLTHLMAGQLTSLFFLL